MPASGGGIDSSVMDYQPGSSGMPSRSKPHSHPQKQEEMLLLGDLVSASPSFFNSTKNLDEEVLNLKNIYETELEKLRKDIEAGVHERNALQMQCNNQQTFIWELQNQLSMETDKNSKLLDEISNLQRRIEDLDSELQDRHATLQQESLDNLHKLVEQLSGEVDQWKHRCEQEQLTNQETRDCLQQLTKKNNFSDQVHDQQLKYYQARLEVCSATIMNLEARIQELNAAHVSMIERQNQGGPSEPSKSEENGHSDSLEEPAKEGTDLPQQKITVEDGFTSEHHQSRGADIPELINKISEVYNMLTFKLNEMPADDGESDKSLQSQIGTLKVLLEEEKIRLEPLSDVDTTKLAGTGQNLSTDMIQRNNSQAGIGSSKYMGVTDKQTIDSTSRGNNVLQQPSASVPVYTTASLISIGRSNMATSYSSSSLYKSGASGSVYPLEQSPPINTFYIPMELRSEEGYTAATSADFDARPSGLNMSGTLFSMTGPRYSHNDFRDQKQHQTDSSSAPITSRPLGPIHARPTSSSVQADWGSAENPADDKTKTDENECDFTTNNVESSEAYDEPYERPRSGQLEGLTSPVINCTDPASSAFEDLKVLEVNEEGKFVRLLNDGSADFDIGGYIVQQTVNGHPVSVFRFPRNTKFPSNSMITVWSAMSDPNMHNPPTDFFWNQQDKWKTGPNCTTALCRANGQVVAWSRAGHRLTADTFHETSTSKQDIDNNQSFEDEASDYENFTQLKGDLNGPKPEPVYLRRAKKQPPSLTASKHPHGLNPATLIHPLTGQPRPLYFGNDNSTYSRQSRTQTIRPDPVPGQPSVCAPVQRNGRKTSIGSSQKAHSAAVKENGTMASSIGKMCEGPSPFMSPHNRFSRGLQQVCSQHHPDFLPPMPKTF